MAACLEMTQHFSFCILTHGCIQGEDVSMGIWMAAIGPARYQVSEPGGASPRALRSVRELGAQVRHWAGTASGRSSSRAEPDSAHSHPPVFAYFSEFKRNVLDGSFPTHRELGFYMFH